MKKIDEKDLEQIQGGAAVKGAASGNIQLNPGVTGNANLDADGRRE